MSFGTPWTIHIYVMVRVLPLEPLEPWPWKEAVTTVQNTTSQVQTTRRNMHGCTYKDLFFWFLSDLIWGTIWPCLQYCLQSWERGCFATRVAGWTKNTVGWVTFGGDQSSYGSIRWITKYCDNLSGRLWAISAYRKLRKKLQPCHVCLSAVQKFDFRDLNPRVAKYANPTRREVRVWNWQPSVWKWLPYCSLAPKKMVQHWSNHSEYVKICE